MKKFLYSLMAATLCLMMTSCGNPASRLKSLAEDISNNGNEWTDTEKWQSVLEDLATTACDFMESDFTEDDVEEFGEAVSELADALNDIDEDKVFKAISKASKKVEKNKELKKRMKAAEKKAKKHLKELDLDEDDMRDIFRGISFF